jgi:hypothetical protein
MENTELQEYVHRKLDCLIGSAFQAGLYVSPNFYHLSYPGGARWVCRMPPHKIQLTFPVGAQCHPFDLVIIGRPVFDGNQWREAGRYLMISRHVVDNVLDALHNGLVGHPAKAQYTPPDMHAWNKIGLAIRQKYKNLGF